MSFFDKKFVKESAENIDEFFDVLNLDEVARNYLVNIDAVHSFEKNEDGTITRVFEIDGERVLENTVELDEEKEVETPFGTVTFSHNLDDDSLNTKVTFNEKEVLIERTFTDDGFTMTLSSELLDFKPAITFKVVE